MSGICWTTTAYAANEDVSSNKCACTVHCSALAPRSQPRCEGDALSWPCWCTAGAPSDRPGVQPPLPAPPCCPGGESHANPAVGAACAQYRPSCKVRVCVRSGSRVGDRFSRRSVTEECAAGLLVTMRLSTRVFIINAQPAWLCLVVDHMCAVSQAVSPAFAGDCRACCRVPAYGILLCNRERTCCNRACWPCARTSHPAVATAAAPKPPRRACRSCGSRLPSSAGAAAWCCPYSVASESRLSCPCRKPVRLRLVGVQL